MSRSKSKPLYQTTPFALGFFSALSVAALLWVATGSSWDQVTFIEFLPAAGSFLASFVSLFIAYFVFSEQVRTRQAATDPVILLHLGTREDAPLLIMLYISNVGAGAALNVAVEFDAESASDWTKRGGTAVDLSNVAKSIRAIPQDAKVSYPLNTYPGMSTDPPLLPLRARVKFEDVDGGKYSSEHTISIAELAGQNANKTPIAQIAERLQKIEKSLEHLASKNHKFFAVTETLEENRSRVEADRKAFLDQMNAHKGAQE
jgi:hypothetical protein